MQTRASYSQAIRLKYPEQVVIGIAKDAGGRCNPITLGWAMITSRTTPRGGKTTERLQGIDDAAMPW